MYLHYLLFKTFNQSPSALSHFLTISPLFPTLVGVDSGAAVGNPPVGRGDAVGNLPVGNLGHPGGNVNPGGKPLVGNPPGRKRRERLFISHAPSSNIAAAATISRASVTLTSKLSQASRPSSNSSPRTRYSLIGSEACAAPARRKSCALVVNGLGIVRVRGAFLDLVD